jgi:YVTN family beta-propeller protein
MRNRGCLFLFVVLLSLTVCVNAWAAPFAYITNWSDNNVTVIDTSTHTVIGSPIPVGTKPYGVAVNSAGTRVYVVNIGSSDVTVIW